MSENAEKLNENGQKIIELIENLKVIDMLNLVKTLEEKWGVSAAAMPTAMPTATVAAEEPSSFEVVVTDASANKIAAIKLIKEIKNIGLGEAKAAVDALPYSLGEFDSKEKAEELAKRFKDISVVVEIK